MNQMLARIEAGHTAQQRFVGDASHELRSPLTTIISALEVAVAHPEVLGGELDTSTLMPEALRMKALIDDLLLLARADERGLTMAREDVDLDDLVARGGRLSRERLTIRTDVTPTGSRRLAALSQVLRNLLNNAARHAACDVTVDGRVRSPAVLATTTVSDRAADRERVFDRFVRLDPDRSEGRRRGVGLAIVREIVAAHRAASRSGTGSVPGRV